MPLRHFCEALSDFLLSSSAWRPAVTVRAVLLRAYARTRAVRTGERGCAARAGSIVLGGAPHPRGAPPRPSRACVFTLRVQLRVGRLRHTGRQFRTLRLQRTRQTGGDCGTVLQAAIPRSHVARGVPQCVLHLMVLHILIDAPLPERMPEVVLRAPTTPASSQACRQT